MYYHRQLERKIIELTEEYACLTLFGARQTGKSTMIRNLFPEYEYVTLDSSRERILATDDPELFLSAHGTPLIIDEIQKAPGLMENIKIRIDEAKLKRVNEDVSLPIMYILTGSNTHEIREGASESLAGRTALIEVSSLSECEKLEKKGCAFIPDIEVLKRKQTGLIPKNRYEVFDEIFLGGMPEYWTLRLNRDTFFESYIATYLEKDVSRMVNVGRLDDFRKFMRVVALRTSQQLDYTEIGNAVGIDARTAKNWISILESSGIVMILQPYANNLAKRIIKTPKIYFMDTGLCAFLCGWTDAGILEASSMAGAFFETYVVSEIVKSIRNDGKRVENTLYYYRDRDQKEVDLIFEIDQTLYPVEIKKGIGKDKANKNFSILEQYKMPIATGLVIDTSDRLYPLSKDAYYCPVGMIGI
ncbi:MAG: ATP-binding protein [Oscillospiraceae bacterium]|nr:ATP-binding protein [Oscillospiraceae bacterium]